MNKTVITFDVAERYTHYIINGDESCPKLVLDFLDDAYNAYYKGHNYTWSRRDNLGTTSFTMCEVSNEMAVCEPLLLTYWQKV